MSTAALVYGHASEHTLYKSHLQVQRSPLLCHLWDVRTGSLVALRSNLPFHMHFHPPLGFIGCCHYAIKHRKQMERTCAGTGCMVSVRSPRIPLDLIDVFKVEVIIFPFLFSILESVVLVHAEVFWQFAVGFERTGLIGQVLEDHVCFVILEVSQTDEYDVSLFTSSSGCKHEVRLSIKSATSDSSSARDGFQYHCCCFHPSTYRVHPHFLAHLTTDVTQPLHSVDALCRQASVAKHLEHLCVFCTFVDVRRQHRQLLHAFSTSLPSRADSLRLVHVPCPSSLNTSSRFSSLSFFPRLRFFPPFPAHPCRSTPSARQPPLLRTNLRLFRTFVLRHRGSNARVAAKGGALKCRGDGQGVFSRLGAPWQDGRNTDQRDFGHRETRDEETRDGGGEEREKEHRWRQMDRWRMIVWDCWREKEEKTGGKRRRRKVCEHGWR